MRSELKPLGLAATVLLLSLFPLALWWKVMNMRAAEDAITRLGRPLDPSVFWAMCAVLSAAGVWAIGKAGGNAEFGPKDRILVSVFIGAFCFGSAGAMAMIAHSQDQLIGGFQG